MIIYWLSMPLATTVPVWFKVSFLSFFFFLLFIVVDGHVAMVAWCLRQRPFINLPPWLTRLCRHVRLMSFVGGLVNGVTQIFGWWVCLQSCSMSLSGSWTVPTRLPFPHLDDVTFSQPKLKYDKAPQLSHMLPEDLMPSKIRGNPKLLLHNSAASTRMLLVTFGTTFLSNKYLANSPFEGKYGTILDGQDSFIVTPNSSIMPRPPIGAQHEVYMRANYWYGIDDHLQWPQAYIEQFLHFACIHRVAPEGAKALHPLFHRLTNYDFVECDNTAIVKGVGCLRHLMFLRLQSACPAVIDSVGSVSRSNTVLNGLRSHISIIELLLGCLHALPTSFTQVSLTIAETQRVACELHAFIEYMTIYKPLMEAPESDVPSMPVDDTLVGAFSNDTTIIQCFFKAGIPVWRIVTMKDPRGVHIDRLSDFTMPPFVDKPCPLRLPLVFIGSSRDPQKYHKIQDFTMHSIRWVDPFALSTPIIMGWEDVPVSVLTTSNAHYSPCKYLLFSSTLGLNNPITFTDQKKASGSRAKGTSHQLTDPKHPFLPPLVEPWRLRLSLLLLIHLAVTLQCGLKLSILQQFCMKINTRSLAQTSLWRWIQRKKWSHT